MVPAPAAARARLPGLPARRGWLLAALGGVPALAGCLAGPWPRGINDQPSSSAAERLAESAQAHGLDAYRALRDINLSYALQWRTLATRLQPALADAGYRAHTEERIKPASALMAQAHRGPLGRRQMLRILPAPGQQGPGDLAVWTDGQPDARPEVREPAALACDIQRLCLLGPMVLRNAAQGVSWGAPETIDARLCDLLHLRLQPGLGLSGADRVALWVDREQGLVRRLRLSLQALPATLDTVTEIDLFDHLPRHGVVWPTRFAERLVRPIPELRLRDWQLTGLDVDRGYGDQQLAGPEFGPQAAQPARPLLV